jgi:hypothetical protein
MGQQFGFERAPPSLSLGIIVGVTRPAIAGQRLGFFDARPARRAGILTAAVGVDNQAGSRLAQRQDLLQGREYQFGGHLLVEVPAHYAPRAGIAPGRQVTLALADQGQVGDIPDPYLIGGRGRGLAKEQVFGHDRRGVGHGGAQALRPGTQHSQTAATQPAAQGIVPDGVPFSLQLCSQATDALALGMAQKGGGGRRLPSGC